MIKNFLKIGSLVMFVVGAFKLISGDGTGAIMIAVATIVDLQAGHMDLTERILALESKEKKNATEPTQST